MINYEKHIISSIEKKKLWQDEFVRYSSLHNKVYVELIFNSFDITYDNFNTYFVFDGD